MSSRDLLERLRVARLHRQRSAVDLDRLVEASVGLHSTDYATPYLSAWARLPALDWAGLFARLNAGDGLFRINAMRNTVHVVHARDVPVVLAATATAVGAVARRVPGLKGLSEDALQAGIRSLDDALAGGPLTTNELKARLPALAADVRYWVMLAMSAGRVVRADSPHLRSNRTRYAAIAHRLPGFEPGAVDPAEARRTLLRRAVEAFGPLTVDDLSWWLPAPKSEVARALAAAGAAVRSVEADGATWWYPEELADAPSPPRESLGAWVLPYEDAFLKGYFDRRWLFAPGVREVVFPRSLEHWAPPEGVA
ncbi:MAG: crosslink repair DNA glycosylase YcaQ family protein, partial [Myxococcota bacterium]